MLPDLRVVMLPDLRVVMLPDLRVVMLPLLSVVMLPARAFDEIAAVRMDAQTKNFTRFIVVSPGELTCLLGRSGVWVNSFGWLLSLMPGQNLNFLRPGLFQRMCHKCGMLCLKSNPLNINS
jgi:hypothetical protein